MKTLGIVGYSGIDITTYIAIALRNIGHKVAIRDKSPNMELLRMLLPEDATDNNADYYGIPVFTQKSDIPGDADFLVLHYGTYTESERIPSHDYIFLTTDMFPMHAKALSNCVLTYQRLQEKKQEDTSVDVSSTTPLSEEGDENKPNKGEAKKKKKQKKVKVEPFRLEIGEPLFIINHYIDYKYGKNYLLSLAMLDISKKSVHTLPFNTSDYKTLLSIGHEKFTLSSLSESYRTFIQKAVLLLTGAELTRKQRKALFK